MSDNNFTPKLGRIRDDGRAHPIRHAKRIMGEAAEVRLRPVRFAGHIGPNAFRRGLAQGTVSASGLFPSGTRRVVVRARYTRQKPGELGAAQAHLRYIQRDVSPVREIRAASTMLPATMPMGVPSSSGRSTIRTNSASSFLPRTAIG